MIELVEDPALADYPLPPTWTTGIDAARGRIAKADSLLSALENDDCQSFLDLFDARIIRKSPDRFRPHEELLSEWTRSEVLPLEGLGLQLAVGRASLVAVEEPKNAYRVRWTWPQQRFSDECILAIRPDEPDPDVHPRDLDAQHRLPLDRQSWESGGGSRVIHVEPEWAGSCVIVWALIDLGFRTFASHPLLLGRLDKPKRRLFGRWKARQVLSRRDDPETSGPPPQDDMPQPGQDKDDPP
jgi:hypothetical protein